MTLTHREVLWFVFCVSLFFLYTLSVMTALMHFPDVLPLPQSCLQGFPDAWCLFRTSVKPLAVWMHLQVVFPFFNLNTIPFDLWNLIYSFLRGTHGGRYQLSFSQYRCESTTSWAEVETKVQALSLQAQHSNPVDGICHCWYLELHSCHYSFPLLGVR